MDTNPGPSTSGEATAPLLAAGLDPVFWPLSRTGVHSAWIAHVPFAHWLVSVLRPRSIVELGTHNGVSYAAFCEAVQRGGLACRCLAVDTWEGDPQAGFYGEAVYEDLRRFHDARYGGFSDLLRSTFDEALQHVPDGSIDLLHIDGLHTYEAVRADFEAWRPKLSARAVVLFHDTCVRHGDFGVWRLWAELAAQYPAFEFLHGHGLGVLGVGPEMPAAMRELAGLPDRAVGMLRERFALLGERWHGEMAAGLADAAHRAALDEAMRRAVAAEEAFHASRAEVDACMRDIGLLQEAAKGLEQRLVQADADAVADRQAREAEAQASEAALAAAHAATEAALAAAEATRHELESMRPELLEACRQRDTARLALRRAAVFAENGWRARHEEAEARATAAAARADAASARAEVAEAVSHEARERAAVATARAELMESVARDATAQAEAWEFSYRALRGKLDRLLRGLGIAQATRLVPGSVRQALRKRLVRGP